MAVITNEQARNFIIKAGEIAETKSLPVRITYAMRYNANLLSDMNAVYSEEERRIIKKYTLINENGTPNYDDNGNIQLSSEDVFAELKELSNCTADLEIKFVSLKDLENAELAGYDRLSALEVNAMMFMINED